MEAKGDPAQVAKGSDREPVEAGAKQNSEAAWVHVEHCHPDTSLSTSGIRRGEGGDDAGQPPPW